MKARSFFYHLPASLRESDSATVEKHLSYMQSCMSCESQRLSCWIELKEKQQRAARLGEGEKKIHDHIAKRERNRRDVWRTDGGRLGGRAPGQTKCVSGVREANREA